MRNLLLVLCLGAGALMAASPGANAGAGQSASSQLDSIVLGAGCFWGVEKRFEAMPGVVDAVAGYADGRGHELTYREITRRRHRNNPDNYAEVVEVTFDQAAVGLERILQRFFEQHDPTQRNRQGNDIGTQYRSTILTRSDDQVEAAERVLAQYQELLHAAGYGEIVTTIRPLDEFHRAEAYHQDYLEKNPDGYCPDHSTGVTFDSDERMQRIDNSELMDGRHIVVIEAEHCPYCEKFRADVADDYRGSIPMTWRRSSQLDGLTIKTPTWATPTILFLEDGREVAGYQGYMAPAEFYRALGHFRLGDSEAYEVAFGKGTDRRFCRQYEQFKNTPPGVFVDKLSGRPLFDTDDRFNSGSGWLSFTRPVPGAVTEHADNSLGMQRTEVRSKSSGIHLGHVFDDGPDGQPRYCINATVLEFRARDGEDGAGGREQQG